MKQGWELKDFEECIDRIPRTTKIPKKQFLTEGEYPIVSQEDSYINGYWDNPQDIFKVDRPIVIFGDHTKKIKYIDFDFALGADGVKVLLPVKTLDSKFFYYQLKSIDLNSLGYARHYRLLKQEKIVIPPLAEQKQIVAKLDECFAAIDKASENTNKNLDNAKQLFQSELNEIFTQKGKGWIEKKLGDVCEVLNGGTPSTNNKEYWNGGILWITPKDMGRLEFTFVSNTSRTISKLGLQKSSAKLIPAHSIILSTRAPIGYLAINTVQMATNQGCRGIIVNKKDISNDYLFYFLKKSVELLNTLGVGTTFKELSTKALSSVKIPIPPLSEQKQIVKLLDSLQEQTQSLESKYQTKLNSLDELKKSLLKKAFNGKLI